MTTNNMNNGSNSSTSLVSLLGTMSRSDILTAAAAVVDHHRFESRVDEILARYDEEDEQFCALYPDSDALEAQGVDIIALADMLASGAMTAERLSNWWNRFGWKQPFTSTVVPMKAWLN